MAKGKKAVKVPTGRLRRYAEHKSVVDRVLRWPRQDLAAYVAERLIARYKRRTAFSDVTLAEWLLECGRLESTYSDSAFGYDVRCFWAARTVKEAVELTLGPFSQIVWFLRELEDALGVKDQVVVDIDTIQGGDYKGDWTIAFRAP